MSNAKFIIGQTGGQIDLSISPYTPSAPDSGYVSVWTNGSNIYMVNSAGQNILQGGTGAAGTSGTSGINGSSGTSGINGTSGTSGVNGTSGTSGTSGVSGTSGTSGINGLGLLAKNIYITDANFTYIGSPSFTSYTDIVFSSPFGSTNYSVDFQYNAPSQFEAWSDFFGVLSDVRITNKTSSGFRLSIVGTDVTIIPDFQGYVQCIALGETGVPTQGPVGPTGATGPVGPTGSAGLAIKNIQFGGTAGWALGTDPLGNPGSSYYDVTFASSFPNTNYTADFYFYSTGVFGDNWRANGNNADGVILLFANKTASGIRVWFSGVNIPANGGVNDSWNLRATAIGES